MFILSQGLFSFSGPASEKGWRGTRNWEGTQPGQLTQLAKGIFHTIGCHAEYINWGELAGAWPIAAGDWLGISQQVVSRLYCASLVFFSLLFGFYSSPLLPSSL